MKEKYGRLAIIKSIKGTGYSLCRCDCGTVKEVYTANLKAGRSKSCGCLRKELAKERRVKKNEYELVDNVVYVKATNTGNVFIVDRDKWESIKNISWYEGRNGYIQHKVKGEKVKLLHRVIMDAPEGLVVDHINHNKKDNRVENLRICSYKDNALNRKKKPSGIVRIQRNSNYYYVLQLKGNKENKYRGCFKTEEEASKERDKILAEEYL